MKTTRHWIALLALAGVAARAVARAAALRRGVRAAPPAPDKQAAERAELHHEKLHSYQALLDESLHLTFPASDPICATAATHCGDRMASPRDEADWRLDPGSRVDPRKSPDAPARTS